jgi:glyoxylase-like metal-dependent hydrolase (beta-lactamase superfamily II)
VKIRLTLAALAVVLAGCSESGSTEKAAPKFQLQVFTSSPNGYSVTSTLISGERDAILIDPQFLKSDAMKVAQAIKATGKNLTMVYSTHAHPDHLFGIAVMKEQFPNVRYVALPQVADRVVTGWPARRNFWFPTYGDELPSETPILPEKLATPELELEGEKFPITGEVVGDGPGNSFVRIPSMNAIVAGDVIFNQSHFGQPADSAPWIATLDQIAALNPTILVAGHQKDGAPNDPGAIQWMKTYMSDFAAFKAESKNAGELKMKMLQKYPGLALENLLDTAATNAFAPPGKDKAKAKAK